MSKFVVPPLNERDPAEIGEFALRGRLGEGGMGTVYLAERATDHELVALKVIRSDVGANPEFVERFEREVRSVQAVNSERVAAFVDSGIDGGIPWLAIRYQPGLTLQDWVDKHGPLEPDQVELLAVGLLEGLDDIHRAGFVHRDLKPSNVLLSPGGPVIIDFGVATATDETSITRTGRAIGSPGWMAPEQVTGDETTRLTDVFSWACVVQFASTGISPFGRGRPDARLYRVLHAEPAPHGLENPLGAAVTDSLDKNPVNRPTAAQTLHMLSGTQTVLDAFSRLDLPLSLALPPIAQKPRGRRVAAAVLLAIISGAAAFLLAMSSAGSRIEVSQVGADTSAITATGATSTNRTDSDQAPAVEDAAASDAVREDRADCRSGAGPIRPPLVRATDEDDDVRALVGSLWPGTQFSTRFSGFMRDMTALPDGRVAGIAFDNSLIVWDPADPVEFRSSIEPLATTAWVIAPVGDSGAAVGSADGTVQLFDAAAAEDPPLELRWHDEEITALLGLCDGRVAAASRWSNAITIWEPSTNQLRLLEDPEAPIGALTRLDESRLVSGNDAGTVRIWNLDKPDTEPVTLNGDLKGIVNDLIVLDSGTIVAIDALGVFEAWAPGTTELLATRTLGPTDWFGATALAIPGDRVAIGRRDGASQLWHPESDRVIELEAGRPLGLGALEVGDENRELAATNDGRLVAVSTDDVLRIWPVGESVEDTPLTVAPAAVVALDPGQRTGGHQLALLGDGRLATVGRAFQTFDVDTTIASSAQSAAPVAVVASDGQRLAVGRIDGRVSLFDGDERVLSSVGERSAVAAIALTPGGLVVASNTTIGTATIELLAPNSDPQVRSIEDVEVTSLLALNTEAVAFVVGTATGDVLLFGLDGEISEVAIGADGPILDMVYLDDNRVAVAGDDSAFWLLNLATLQIQEVAHPFGSPAPMTAWQGSLVTAGGSGRVRVWDTTSFDVPEPIETGTNQIVDVSTRGPNLAVADETGTIVLIDETRTTLSVRELSQEIVAIGDAEDHLVVASPTGVSALTLSVDQ